jgi:type IV pilus assembly protein PilB
MSDTSVIEIDGQAALAGGPPVRRLVYMVLLLAVKDRATEVRFEPSPPDREWKLRYHVDRVWYEMVPVPLRVPISREVGRLAGLGLARRLRSSLARLVTGSRPAQETRVRLRVAGRAVDLGVTIGPAEVGGAGRADAVAVRLPEGDLPSEEARRILTEYTQSRPATESWPDEA